MDSKNHEITGELKIAMLQHQNRFTTNGKVEIAKVMQFPMISELVQRCGMMDLHMSIYLLILDFSNSLNLKYSMNDAQMLEAADMLLQQCGNYRLEDYVAMFTMAKRNKLGVEVMHALDITVISKIEQAYDRWSTAEINRLEDKKYQHEKETRQKQPISGPVVDILTKWADAAEREIKAKKEKEEEIYRQEKEKYKRKNEVDIDEVAKQFSTKNNAA